MELNSIYTVGKESKIFEVTRKYIVVSKLSSGERAKCRARKVQNVKRGKCKMSSGESAKYRAGKVQNVERRKGINLAKGHKRHDLI